MKTNVCSAIFPMPVCVSVYYPVLCCPAGRQTAAYDGADHPAKIPDFPSEQGIIIICGYDGDLHDIAVILHAHGGKVLVILV